MSNKQPERDELWMAYLDGELSASESAAFDATLSDAQRERAQGEIRLEAALASRLSAGPVCPEALWTSLQAQIKGGAGRPWWQLERRWRIAAAAVLAVGAWGGTIAYNFGHLLNFRAETPFVMAATSVQELTRGAEVRGDYDSVQRFMNDHKLGIQLLHTNDAGASRGHQVTLCGAGMEDYGGMKVPVVYFECCLQPVKVVLMHECHGSASEHAGGSFDICGEKSVGQFEAIVVSKHHHSGRVLDLFDRLPIKAAAFVTSPTPKGDMELAAARI